MMNKERLKAEQEVLKKKLPDNIYRFMDMDTPKPFIVMAAKTNCGNVYTIRIELNEFPNQIPKVFVKNKLTLKSGEPMPEYSHAMHTLGSENGMTRICHYGDAEWTPMISIYKVYVRCRLWLEVYEIHHQTGNDMAYYLKSAQ